MQNVHYNEFSIKIFRSSLLSGLLIILICSINAFAVEISKPHAEIRERFVEQKLDHFDRQNRQTWEMVICDVLIDKI